MPGTNKPLKAGQYLFKSGDKSDGMYIVRKGEVRVCLEKDGKEVVLANIPEGAIVGEMAFFDAKPRSATVKANKDSEVTLISNDDFSKLLKQIPKWFVTLMEALSGRLRQTNDRLQKLEGLRVGKPHQNTIRLLHMLNLLWHKDGKKEGKDWLLNRETALATLASMFGEGPELMVRLTDTLVKHRVIGLGKDPLGQQSFTIPNRGALDRLIQFIAEFTKTSGDRPCLSDDAIALLETLQQAVAASPYDAPTIGLDDLKGHGAGIGHDTTNWPAALSFFRPTGDAVSLAKTGTGPGLKTTKKEIAAFVANHKILVALTKAGLI